MTSPRAFVFPWANVAHRHVARTVLHIGVRLAALLAAWNFLLVVPARWLGPNDDGLGLGLLTFLLVATVGFVWAMIDGSRRPFGTVVTIWSVAAVGFALITGPQADDLTFFISLAGVPAAVGLLLGAGARLAARATSPQPY